MFYLSTYLQKQMVLSGDRWNPIANPSYRKAFPYQDVITEEECRQCTATSECKPCLVSPSEMETSGSDVFPNEIRPVVVPDWANLPAACPVATRQGHIVFLSWAFRRCRMPRNICSQFCSLCLCRSNIIYSYWRKFIHSHIFSMVASFALEPVTSLRKM